MVDPRRPRHFSEDLKRQNVKLYNNGKPVGEIMAINEWLTEDVDDADISFLFELVERRYSAKPTVICTQNTPAEWHMIIVRIEPRFKWLM